MDLCRREEFKDIIPDFDSDLEVPEGLPHEDLTNEEIFGQKGYLRPDSRKRKRGSSSSKGGSQPQLYLLDTN